MATRRTGKEKDRTEEPVICPICTEEVVDHNGRKKAVITLFSVMGSVKNGYTDNVLVCPRLLLRVSPILVAAFPLSTLYHHTAVERNLCSES